MLGGLRSQHTRHIFVVSLVVSPGFDPRNGAGVSNRHRGGVVIDQKLLSPFCHHPGIILGCYRLTYGVDSD